MTYTITINDEELPILVRKRRGTRRFTLRYQPQKHAVSLTLPPYASLRQGLRFTEERSGWIARQIEKKPKHIPFCDGQIIPMLGKEYTLKHCGGRGIVRIAPQSDDGYQKSDVKEDSFLTSDIRHLTSILVPGDAAFMARRVREFLKAQAREEITRLAHAMAARIGKRVGKIALRDTTSCWGSCSHHGNLSFSWRLVFAPREVLEYLVAHEVAHLKERNHSPKFWAVVAELFPAYKEARAWLKRHGEMLYGYG